MKTFKTILALLALTLSTQLLSAQSKGVLSISTSPVATTADYDKVIGKLKEKGLMDLGWSFHAAGAAQPAGLFTFGIFPNREAFDNRAEKVKPVFEETGAKPKIEVFEIHNSFVGTVPETKPAAGIVVHFNGAGMTAAQYDQIIPELQKVTSFPPDGQISHVCYTTAEGLKVVDVWESAEKFGAFGEKLMPVLKSVGIDPGQPVVYSLHNYLKTNN